MSPTIERPNILVVLTDQQFGDALGCVTDHLETPNLDRLASAGVRFPDTYCANPLCTPSRAALVTGRFPHEVGVTDNGEGIEPSHREAELGTLLSAAGYDCGYGGKWHVTSYDDQTELDAHGFEQYCGFDDHDLADACVEFIERERDDPFLAVASFDNPHNICEWARHQHLPWGDVSRPPVEECPPLPRNFAPPAYEPTAIRPAMEEHPSTWGAMVDAEPDEWRQYRHAYYRLVEKVDKAVGRILDGVNAAGVAEETVVIFTSDHGDMHGAHQMNQKGWLYEESVRVPLIVRAPDGDEDRIDDRLVSLLDLLPTVCDYADVNPPESVRGRSLRPLVEGRQPEAWRDHLVVETGRPLDGRMVRTADYKYAVYIRGRDREQLFSMDGDRAELVDLATSADHREILDEHRRLLLAWGERTDDELIPGRMLSEEALNKG